MQDLTASVTSYKAIRFRKVYYTKLYTNCRKFRDKRMRVILNCYVCFFTYTCLAFLVSLMYEYFNFKERNVVIVYQIRTKSYL